MTELFEYTQALNLATELREAAPADTDALALQILMLQVSRQDAESKQQLLQVDYTFQCVTSLTAKPNLRWPAADQFEASSGLDLVFKAKAPLQVEPLAKV